MINSPIGVYREESFTSNMFNGNFKQIHAYKIDQWHQVVFEFYNLQWNIEENEKWMYGTYGGTIAHNRSSYRIINPIIVEDANIVYGLYTFTDACGVFKGNINNGVIGLKEQISTIEEKTDALSSEVDNIKGLIVGGTSKNTFEYNNSKDTISYITSPFDDDNNLELGVTIHRESKPFYVNGLFNFSSLNLVNKNDNRKTLVSIVQDDITPANFNRAYHGANHGNSDLRLCACQAHGKTFADIGSVWSNGDNNYTIVGIEDENNLYLLGDNTKTYPVFNMNRAPVGTYTHINGATNISSFTVTDSAVAQLKPATRLQDIRIYADDKLITENGKYEFSELKVCEIYDIKNVADILSRIKDSVGTYISNPPFGELENIPSVARMSISYIFKSASQWFMAISFTALQNMEFHFFGFTQQQILSGSNIKLYIPKLLPINNGFSNVDFRTYIPLEVSSNIIATSEYWENPNLPPDRWIETNDNVAVHSGYLFDYGVGGDNRKDNISEALHLYTTKKMYPRGANTKIQLNEGNGIGAVVWRTYIPISKINKSGILCINSFEYGNGLYIYADFNKPGIYDINIDNRYIGKEVYVFENSGNVKLMTPISTSKIYIKVNTNEPMYGYIVMQIKP